MTTIQIAKEIVKQSERAYSIIEGELHRLEMEEMTMGKNEFRTFEMDRLQSISLVLLAQRESLRSLAWMIEQDAKKVQADAEFLNFVKGNVRWHKEDENSIRIRGWVFRGENADRWEEIIAMLTDNMGR